MVKAAKRSAQVTKMRSVCALIFLSVSLVNISSVDVNGKGLVFGGGNPFGFGNSGVSPTVFGPHYTTNEPQHHYTSTNEPAHHSSVSFAFRRWHISPDYVPESPRGYLHVGLSKQPL